VGHFYPNLLICLEADLLSVGHPAPDFIDFFSEMVVDAVFSERVSGKNSLLTGNLTGKNRKFGLFRIVSEYFTPIYSAKRKSYRPFPCYLNNRE